MKNTRLYFDKDFKPITKLALSLRLPGATPNFETAMDVIVKGDATGVADRPTWIGTTRVVCESQSGHAFDDILATPSLLTDQNNSTESDYDVFLKAEQGTTLAGLEPLDGPIGALGSKYQELVASKDINYILKSIDTIEITDWVGNVVDVLIPGFMLKMDVKGTPNSYATDGYIYFETSLNKILRSAYHPVIDKWFKIKLTYTAGIELSEKAKEYFKIDESSELKQRTATYYLVNTLYRGPAIYIDVFGDTGTFDMEDVDIVTNVYKADLSKQADGTWTLDFSYDLKDNHIEMLGVSSVITNIPDDLVKSNSQIHLDTTYGPSPVPFIIKSRR